MNSFRYFIVLSYNGSAFHGWQVQPNVVSVQGVLNNAISLLLNEQVNIIGCGRTDTGVHARKFVAHFDTSIHKIDCEQLVFKLNSFLPQEIVVYKICQMDNNAHSRFDAIKRTYKYYVNLYKNTFDFPYSLYVYNKLDVDKMNEAASKLLEYKDFTSFSKKHTDTKTNDCDIFVAKWEYSNANNLIFTISANRFLRNMVRSIVGTLIEVGQGKLSIQEFCEIIEAKDRCKAKMSAPAYALFLENIEYTYDI